MAETKLTAEMKKNIDNYGSEITEVENNMEAIRLRPGMYIGPIGSRGFVNMFREIFQNAIDQILDDESPADFIHVVYDERTCVVTITDNGKGIPFDWMINVFSHNHTGKNLKNKKKGQYSTGLHGIGSKAVNALSEYYEVTSYHYSGEARKITFRKGKLVDQKDVPNEDHFQGTKVEFMPDHSIMGDTTTDAGILYMMVKDLLSLLPIGTKIEFDVIDRKGIHKELLVNENGIIGRVLEDCNALVAPIYIAYDTGEMRLDTAFTYNLNGNGDCEVIPYANMCPTSSTTKLPSDNTHVQGTLEGIASWFCNYMNKTYLSDREKQKIKVIPADVRTGLKIMISAFHLDPIFTGQAKEVFSNAEYKQFAKDTVMSGLDEWAKAKSQDLLKICKYLKDMADARIKMDSEKEKVTAKYTTSASTGLPEKYVPPSGNWRTEDWELFIVEGDSALGSAKSARNTKNQAIFPIRGKILNALHATPAKIRANAELMGIAQILGGGIGKNFDISKVKFKRVIFMTDADNDGAHIAELLATDFMVCFPGMIEAGMVFKAVPPLYGIPIAGKKMKYFARRLDFIQYMQKEFYKRKNSVLNSKKQKIAPDEFSAILLDNVDYIYDFRTIMERNKLNPILLENILISYVLGEKLPALKKRITSKFRFIEDSNIEKIGDTIKIKGLIGDRIETVFINDRFYEECKDVIPQIRKALDGNYMTFYVDGIEYGLYDLVNEAMNYNNHISRFKGLGEMEDFQLRETTMGQDSRTLIRYTIEDLDESMRIIRRYDSDKSLIFSKIRNISRDDLLGL